MNSTATVIELFPAQTVESLAAEFLKAKRAAAEAEARIKELGPKLLAALAAEGDKGCAVPGLGAVTRYEAAPQMRLDGKAATKLLQEHSLEVPLSPVGGGMQLRATLV